MTIIAAILLTHGLAAAEGATTMPTATTAIYYGPNVPHELFAHYDRVVVEADHFATVPASPRAQVLAYVSVGEINASRAWYKDVPAKVVLGTNGAWGSQIVDTKSVEWQAFLLDRVVEPLWKKGYRGFFFDTLDSYKLLPAEVPRRADHARAIGRLITTLQTRHPDAKVVLNRGFDVHPHVPRIDGLVVESLCSTCDPSGTNCRAVPAAEHKALLALLRDVRARRGVPITVVDYVPAANLTGRRATAKRIAELGFAPYVTSPALDEYGIGGDGYRGLELP